MSNLVKNYTMKLESDEKKVLDMNDLVERRIRILSAKMERPENAGFVAGIVAGNVEVGALLGDAEEGGTDGFTAGITGETGNVIKAHPEPQAEPQVDPAEAVRAANEEAESILNGAREEADRILQDARAQAEDERRAAREEGSRQGYEEGERKAREEFEQERRKLEEEHARMEADYQAKFDEIEPRMVDAITDIYHHIFQTDLSGHREILLHLVAVTLQRIEGTRNFLIHVGKDDYEYLCQRRSTLEEAAALPGSVVEIVEDMTLPGGSCTVETDGGIFDCGVETELAELTQKLKLLSYSR